MASPTKDSKTLQHLNTHWNNKSHSSITTTSDTITFHSAHAQTSIQMELHALTTSPLNPVPVTTITMSRQDSGYSEPQSPTLSSRRTSTSLSTSSTRHTSPSKSKRRTCTSTSNTTSSRPTTKRAARSSPQTVQLPNSSYRPSLQSRNTQAPYTTLTSIHSNQFFQFPSLDPPPPQPSAIQPPPTTVQYWTSDSTRRLEYAAIDAASKGVRGFLVRLLPDCILPRSKRRMGFCEGDEGSEAGSVRRYRLELPEEKGVGVRVGKYRRRWGFGKRSA